MRTLINAQRAPGEGSVEWDGLADDGRPVSGGVYICVLEALGQRLARRMLLVR